MNNAQVIVEVRGVFGRELYYPVSAAAGLFTSLLGRQTLTRSQLQVVKELGFSVVITAPSPAQI